MTTLNDVKQVQLQARKDRDSIKASLLTTVIGEVQNRVTSHPVDKRTAEVENTTLQEVLNSFLKKNREAQEKVKGDALDVLKQEAQIIASFQPKRLSEAELTEIVKSKFPNLDIKDKGRAIGQMKREYGELIDSYILMKAIDSIL